MLIHSKRLIKKGFKRDLTRQDMWEIDSSETSEIVTKKLEREWNKGMENYRRTIHTNETANSNHNNVNNSTINNKTKNLTAIYKTKIENK